MATLIYDKATHEARKYWRDRLDAMSFVGHLALDHPRPQDSRRQLTALERPLAPEAHALLRRLSGGNPFLAYTVLLSALQVCCHKYSGEREVTMFIPSTSEGAALTLLPISGAVDASASFKDALLATKDLLSTAFKHQQYPFSRMLIDLPDERRPTHLPMIAAMVGFNDDVPEARGDVTILFEATEAQVKAAVRFDARVYDEATIRHFFELFDGILVRCLGDPATRIEDLPPGPVHGAAGAAALPASEGVDPRDLCLHLLIAAQAAAHPASVAVVERDRRTTYAALQRDAERLAGTLAGLKLGVHKPVLILMDAGTEMIVSMLAVLEIGAAFAPLKLLAAGSGPLSGILEALDSPCILCQPEHVADLRQLTAGLTSLPHVVTVEYSAPAGGAAASSFHIVCHRSGPQAAPAEEPAPAPATGRGSSTACVLVDGRDPRSSSAVTHAELVSLFQWLNNRCGIGSGDRCLLSPGLGAGAQLYDTLGLLCAGGSVEITDAAGLKDSSLLLERLLAPSITVWDLPTALVQNLLGDLLARRAERADQKGPRNILLSGEKQSASLADKLAQYFPEARITGLYASPGAGIWTTFFPLREDPAEPCLGVAARAIAGFEHQVLNPSGGLAPSYTKGELHLRRLLAAAGPALATGLRAEARERDRMIWLRGDDSCFVKYGCPVELTHVEAVLCRHPAVRAAEVIAVTAGQGGDRSVVAFVLADPEQLSAEAVADDLVLRGGVDLIPDRFIVVDEFPLTADGAIDRDALLARFVIARERTNDGRSAAVDEIHAQLKGIWLDILQVDDVAADESFFTRGGNSLKATLLIARIHDEFGVDLSVQKFFKDPSTRTVAQLIAAEAVDAANLKKAPDFKIVPRERYRVQLPELKS